MEFQVKLQRDGDTFLATCPDLPEFASVGDTEEEALRESVEGIETTLQAYMQDRRPIPVPSGRRRGSYTVRLPAQAVLKLGIYEGLLQSKQRKADLARTLGLHMPQIDRMLDLRHNTRLDQLENAIAALGRRIKLSVELEHA